LIWRAGLLVAESVHFAAVRTNPRNAVARHTPYIFIHAALADGETAAAGPAERGNFAAEVAFPVSYPVPALFSNPGQIGFFIGASHS